MVANVLFMYEVHVPPLIENGVCLPAVIEELADPFAERL